MEQHAHPAVHMKTVDDWGCVDLFKDIYIYIYKLWEDYHET